MRGRMGRPDRRPQLQVRESVTPIQLLGVGIALMGLWFICTAAVSLIAMLIGPFSYLFFGLMLLGGGVLLTIRRPGQ
jgi:uncharacterized membrane protein